MKAYLITLFLCSLIPVLGSSNNETPTVDHVAQGDAFRAQGSFSKAIEEYSKALAKSPSDKRVRYRRALVYMGMEGKEQSALRDLEGIEWGETIREKLETKLGLKGGQEELKKALQAEKEGKWQECVTFADQGVEIGEKSKAIRAVRARCGLKLGEVGLALQDLNVVQTYGNAEEMINAWVVTAKLFYYVYHDYAKSAAVLQKCFRYQQSNELCRSTFIDMKNIEKKKGGMYAGLEEGTEKTWVSVIDLEPNITELKDKVKQEYESLGLETVDYQTHSALITGFEDTLCIAYFKKKLFNDPKGKQYCDKIHARSQSDTPDSVKINAYLYQAESQISTDNYDAAISLLQTALKSHDRNPQLLQKLHETQVALKQSKTKDHYRALGLQRSASEREIRSAYREMSRQYHPDKYSGEMSAEQVDKKMSEINEAYEVLSNPDLKAAYDRGDDPSNPNQFPGGGGFNNQHRGGSPYFGGFGGQGGQGGFGGFGGFGGQGGNPFQNANFMFKQQNGNSRQQRRQPNGRAKRQRQG